MAWLRLQNLNIRQTIMGPEISAEDFPSVKGLLGAIWRAVMLHFMIKVLVTEGYFFCECLLSWRSVCVQSAFPGFMAFSSTSLVAQMVKCLPAVQESRVQPLGWKDPLEKEIATHTSTLAWKIPWTKELGRLLSVGSKRVRHD